MENNYYQAFIEGFVSAKDSEGKITVSTQGEAYQLLNGEKKSFLIPFADLEQWEPARRVEFLHRQIENVL